MSNIAISPYNYISAGYVDIDYGIDAEAVVAHDNPSEYASLNFSNFSVDINHIVLKKKSGSPDLPIGCAVLTNILVKKENPEFTLTVGFNGNTYDITMHMTSISPFNKIYLENYAYTIVKQIPVWLHRNYNKSDAVSPLINLGTGSTSIDIKLDGASLSSFWLGGLTKLDIGMTRNPTLSYISNYSKSYETETGTRYFNTSSITRELSMYFSMNSDRDRVFLTKSLHNANPCFISCFDNYLPDGLIDIDILTENDRNLYQQYSGVVYLTSPISLTPIHKHMNSYALRFKDRL